MRTKIILIVGTILILGLAITPYILIHNSSKELASNLDSVEHTIYQGQWEQATEQLAETHAKWIRTKEIWCSIIDHEEIDNIDISISKLEKYVQTKGLSLAAGEVSALKQLVEHIADKEKPMLNNVF